MTPKTPAKKTFAGRAAGTILRNAASKTGRKSQSWMRRRRASQQPWLRGRIRPTTCRDLREQKET